jgi:hypothetical protein
MEFNPNFTYINRVTLSPEITPLLSIASGKASDKFLCGSKGASMLHETHYSYPASSMRHKGQLHFFKIELDFFAHTKVVYQISMNSVTLNQVTLQ